MKKIYVSSLFLTYLLTLTLLSCNYKDHDESTTSTVEYIGDNSAVAELVSELIGTTYGSYTLELQTEKEPYGLLIHFQEASRTLRTEDFKEKCEQLLTSIKNAGYICIDAEDFNYQLTKAIE